MNIQTINILREIGAQLDQNQFPLVYDDGIVMPSKTAVVFSSLGKEKNYAKSKQRRPSTKSWYGATGRQRQTYKPRSSRETTPIICSNLRLQYEAELDEVQKAYPDTKIWHQAEGLWLLTESSVLSGLERKATFLTAIPYTPTLPPKSWGFWTTAISAQWIGPRHTNFPDGSICAFEPQDKTWVIGDNIIKLLDFYSLWAARHLHLEKLGRWPGYQSVPYPYERLSELKDDEVCGCNKLLDKLYGDCCKKHDLATKDSYDFLAHCIKPREPLKRIVSFIKDRKKPPSISEMYSNLHLFLHIVTRHSLSDY